MHKSWTGHALRALQASLLALSLVAMNLVPLTNAFAQDAGDPAPSEPKVETLAPPADSESDSGIEDAGDSAKETGDTDLGVIDDTGFDAGEGDTGGESGEGDEFGSEFRALFAPLVVGLAVDAPDVTVHIYKYMASPSGVALATGGDSFPMESTWDAENLGGPGGPASYSLSSPTYHADTSPMTSGADYATHEVTGGDILPIGAACEANKYRLVGYRDGTSLSAAQGDTTSTVSPNYTNLTEDMYVIVVNEDCDNPAPPPPPEIPACNLGDDTTFDTFTNGSVDGQHGWSSTGSYDQEVVDNTYGYGTFGCKSLRISNAVASGSFGDQTFSYSVADEAGETAADSGGMSGGTRQNHFEAQFDLGSTESTVQTDLRLSVSPDRGDGARMSYLRFEDQAGGIHVFFDDVTDAGPLGTVADFNETDIATLDRTVAHTIKFSMDFVDGPSNDIVEIYIDGILEITGTTWEDYYRYDPEQAGGGNLVPTVDSLIFRAGGSSVSGNNGNGFLFDNVSLESSTTEAQSCNLVSDDVHTFIGTIPATETFEHDAWLDESDGAKWIWDAPFVTNPDEAQTLTFTRTFDVVGAPGTATLDIAADNVYAVTVNDVPVASCNANGASEPNYGATESCVIPVVPGENTIDFTVTNHAGPDDPEQNPAGLYYKITVDNASCTDVPPVPMSTVTLCKVSDAEGSPGMPGWVLYLKGENLQTGLSVPSTDSSGVNSDPLVAGMSYLLNAMGTWTNQGGANPADAEYSTTDNWTTHMDGYDGYGAGILELEVNQANTDWGPYNGSHSYNQVLTPGASGPVNFRIFDGDTGTHVQNEGWFGDNSGSLSVDIDEAYSGTTGENGCTMIENVPYGTYAAGEIAQEGWTLANITGGEGSSVDGGTVVVDSPTETFTLVNHQEEGPTLKVHILKYLSNGETISPVADDAGLPDFPMTSTWQSANLNGGASTSGSYVLGNYHGGSPSKYGADTSPMSAPADYTTSETTDGSVVVASENECSPGKYVLMGYKSGSTLEEAVASEDISQTPISYTDITSDRYIIVVNKPCGEDTGTPMCVISSDTTTLEGGESSFLATFIHESWTALIDDASWIWGDEAITDPEGTETQTFTKGFSLDSVPATGGTLEIAADNSYSVSVNGILVGADPSEDNYTDGAKDTIVIPAAVLNAGNNTLEITVTNLPMAGGTEETNPAGLKYKLTIDGSNCDEAPSSFKVHIFKYLQDGESSAQIPNDSDAPLFPMIAQYDIAGVWTNLDPGDGYNLGDGGGAGGSDDDLLWAANSIPLHAGDTYGTHEVTDTETSPVVSDAESCEVGKYLLLGYKTGDTLAAAQAAEISETAPNYVDITNSKYVIVVNEDCDDVLNDGGGDGTGTLTVIKNTVGGDSTFQFLLDSENENLDDSIPFSLTTTVGNGHSDSESFELDEGAYEITEFVPSGWNLNISCVYEETGTGIATSPQSESVTVEEGEITTCTFTNSIRGGEGENPGTLHVVKIVDGGNGIPSDFSFQINGGEPTQFEADGQNDLSVAAGAYAVTEVESSVYDATYSEGCTGTMPANDDVTCTITNTANGSGGGGGGGGGSNNNSNNSGQVLGASTDEGQVLGNACTLLTDFMREGMANNPEQVMLLQAFLNGEMTSGLPTSGFFGSLTTAAVNAFQLKYWEEVLKPWADIGMGENHTPTGYVYKTTLWKINDIQCPDLDVPFPTLP